MPLVSHMLLLLNKTLIYEVINGCIIHSFLCWKLTISPALDVSTSITQAHSENMLCPFAWFKGADISNSQQHVRNVSSQLFSVTEYLIHWYQTFIDVPPWLCCSCFFNCDGFLFIFSVNGLCTCLTISYCIFNDHELSNS